MNRALLTSSAPVQRFGLLECTPCAVAHHRKRQLAQGTSLVSSLWSPALCEFAVDAATGAIMLGGASEVLVPVSLVAALDASPVVPPSTIQQWHALRRERRLVVLVGGHDVGDFLKDHPAYDKLCVPTPGGPLAAKMFFQQTETAFYDGVIPHVQASVREARSQRKSDVEWRAWMRSGLTCRYEGTHVAPIRVAERAASLLKDIEGCSQVILEEGVPGLRPRWLETMAKTALSCGVPTAALSLALCESPSATRLMAKSIEVGITQFASSTFRATAPFSSPPPDHYPHASTASAAGLFDGAEPLLRIDTATGFAIGWGEAAAGDTDSSRLSRSEESLLTSSANYAEALDDEWEALFSENDTDSCHANL